MIASALDMFDDVGTKVTASGYSSKTVYNGYNNNSIADRLWLVVNRTAGTGAVGIKLQTCWDIEVSSPQWTDVMDFGNCTEDSDGYLLKVMVPRGKPVLGKYLRLAYTLGSGVGEQTLSAFLTFGAEESQTDIVTNPVYTFAAQSQPKV